jgi:hypothetical protein
MLKFAREFTTSVFPDRNPPQIATAERCVLCQQELDDAAVARLTAFDAYLGERDAEEAVAAKEAFEAAVSAIQLLSVKARANVTTILAGYAALSQRRKEHAETLASFFEKAEARLGTVKIILTARTYDELASLDALPDSPR